jgi:hypothetical protein
MIGGTGAGLVKVDAMKPGTSHLGRVCRVIAPISVALIFYMSAEASESDSSAAAINQISDQILHRELKVFQCGIETKLNDDRKRLGRERRWFLYSLANSSLTSVGAFMSGAARLRYANQPLKAPRNLFENATIIRVTANAVSLSGSLMEFGKEAIDHHSACKRQQDLRATSEGVLELHRQITVLLAQRQTALDSLTNQSDRQLYETEGALLRDLNIAAREDFSAYYDESKGQQAKRFAQLFLVAVSNLVSGAGSLYSGVIVPHEYQFNAAKRTRYGGAGGITDIATGSLNIATPILTTLVDMRQRVDSKTALFKQLGGLHADDIYHLNQHHQNMQTVIRTHDRALDERVLYRQKAMSTIFAILAKHEKDNVAARRAALHNFIISILHSGTDASGSFSKVVNGVGTTIGAYHYTRNDRERFLVTGRSGIIYGIGNAIGAEEVLRDEITRERKHASLKKQHFLLSQQLEDEIKQLAEAQARLAL